MSATTILILTAIALVISIIAGPKLKINIGVLGLFFAFVIGCFCSGLSVSTVISYFPIRIAFVIISVNFFFGFVVHNGTVEGVANRILYATRKHTSLIPYALFFMSYIICGSGAGSVAATVAVAPIGYAIASAAGFSPLIVAAAVNLGLLAMSHAPWTSYGVICNGILQQTFDPAFSYASCLRSCATMTVFFLCSFTIVYMFTFRRNHAKKLENGQDFEWKKPEPFTPVQKKSLVLLVVVLGLVILAPIVSMLFPTDIVKRLAGYCDIQFLAIIGAIVAAILKLDDANKVLERSIPWSLLIMVCGIGTLIAVATNAGIGPVLANMMSDSIPSGLMLGAVALLGCLISMVSDGISVGVATMAPMVATLSATTGISQAALVNAMMTAAAFPSISPLSMGGSQVLSLANHKTEEERQTQYKGQLYIAIFQSLLGVAIALLGVHKIWN